MLFTLSVFCHFLRFFPAFIAQNTTTTPALGCFWSLLLFLPMCGWCFVLSICMEVLSLSLSLCVCVCMCVINLVVPDFF